MLKIVFTIATDSDFNDFKNAIVHYGLRGFENFNPDSFPYTVTRSLIYYNYLHFLSN